MREHVLLVEPDSTLRALFLSFLQEENYLVDAVRTLAGGLRCTLNYHDYCYALIDLPTMSEQDLADLKSLHVSYMDMKIVVFTDQPEVKNHLFEHCAEDFGVTAVFSGLLKLDHLLAYFQSMPAQSQHDTRQQQNTSLSVSLPSCSVSSVPFSL